MGIAEERGIPSEAGMKARSTRPKARSTRLQFYRTLAEIAAALDRKPSTIRKNYLYPLVRRGLLRHRYPERPNRPDQSYMTTDDE
jgi:hypothetical protein